MPTAARLDVLRSAEDLLRPYLNKAAMEKIGRALHHQILNDVGRIQFKDEKVKNFWMHGIFFHAEEGSVLIYSLNPKNFKAVRKWKRSPEGNRILQTEVKIVRRSSPVSPVSIRVELRVNPSIVARAIFKGFLTYRDRVHAQIEVNGVRVPN